MTNFCFGHFNFSPAAVCAEARSQSFPVQDYALAMTLTSGQAFRWRPHEGGWIGVIGQRWVRLQSSSTAILAETVEAVPDWAWLKHYLQLEVNLNEVLATFPSDVPMKSAIAACHGLRLLRQDPWECLASFILSSTKQILQIQQIISLLCSRYGEPVNTPTGFEPAHAFPGPQRLASLNEAKLRECKMGFRAPFLLSAAREITEGKLNLQSVHKMPMEEARAQLLNLRGVGNKIGHCVLLFAYGRQEAFPVDVWIMKALRQLYFSRRKVSLQRLQNFAASHFGPNAGYAQQYLFHYARIGMKKQEPAK